MYGLVMSRNTDFSDGKGIMSGEVAILNSIIKKGFLEDLVYEQRRGFDEGESYVTIWGINIPFRSGECKNP